MWIHSFGDYLDIIIGNYTTPLYYVFHEEVNVPVHTPPLVPDQIHSEDHVSVEAELLARESHTHALYCDDKSQVY